MNRCAYCGSRFHPESHCPKTHGGSARRLHLSCTYCGDRNHDRGACTKAWPTGKPGVRLLDKVR